jgi:hypothetical protein
MGQPPELLAKCAKRMSVGTRRDGQIGESDLLPVFVLDGEGKAGYGIFRIRRMRTVNENLGHCRSPILSVNRGVGADACAYLGQRHNTLAKQHPSLLPALRKRLP